MSDHWSGVVYKCWIANPDGKIEPGVMLVEETIEKHRSFSLPGGKQEQDETPAQTAERETFEESGYASIKLGKLLREQKEDAKGGGFHMRYIFEMEQALKIRENSNTRFFPLARLPKKLRRRHKLALVSIFINYFMTQKKLRAQPLSAIA